MLHNLIKLLAFITLIAISPAVAAPVADFELKPVGGGAVLKSKEARGKYLALHFLLKTECPYCLRHVRSYEVGTPTIAGVEQVFIKPDSEEAIAKWTAKLEGPDRAPIYRDPEAALAKALAIPDGYAFHGETVHYPALVILDPKGEEVFRYVGKSNADRLPFEKFAAKMAELTRPADLPHYNLTAGSPLAVGGYDVVAYQKEAKAAEGTADLASHYAGVEYRFASAANRHAFNAAPLTYLPAYGGWCATAMARGEKVAIDPANFQVTNGRVFLFYKGLLGNAKKDWVADEANLTKQADAAWTKLTAKQ